MTDIKALPIADTITVWQCIGCGRLEAPQNCLGVCQDRKVELVSAWDYAQALVQVEEAYERLAKLDALLLKLAHTTPREGAWKDSYLALQAQAGMLLGKRGDDKGPRPP